MTGFLAVPDPTAEIRALYDADVAEDGFVMNASRLWAHAPAVHHAMFDLMGDAVRPAGLDLRRRGILVASCAAALGDSYCSLAWGSRLAGAADPELAAEVLKGDTGSLTGADRALATWARRVATDPNGTTAGDVADLRDAGFDDAQIFAITAFVALRIAFSTVNDALGAQPDPQFRDSTPPAVLAAVDYGRPIAG